MTGQFTSMIHRIPDVNAKDAHVEYRDNVKKLMTNFIKEQRLRRVNQGKDARSARAAANAASAGAVAAARADETKSGGGGPQSALDQEREEQQRLQSEQRLLDGFPADGYDDHGASASGVWPQEMLPEIIMSWHERGKPSSM